MIFIDYICTFLRTDERICRLKTEVNFTEHGKHHRPTVCGEQLTPQRGSCKLGDKDANGMMYACTECEKCFLTRTYLSQHMNVHSNKYNCGDCGRNFPRGTELTRHRRSHSGEKPFECSVCEKRFTTAWHLTEHNRIHSGAKPYKCSFCDKTFSRSSQRKTHMTVHTGYKPYRCPLCDWSFSRLSVLQEHKRGIHSSRNRIPAPTVESCSRELAT